MMNIKKLLKELILELKIIEIYFLVLSLKVLYCYKKFRKKKQTLFYDKKYSFPRGKKRINH